MVGAGPLTRSKFQRPDSQNIADNKSQDRPHCSQTEGSVAQNSLQVIHNELVKCTDQCDTSMNDLPTPPKCPEGDSPDLRASEGSLDTIKERSSSCVKGPLLAYSPASNLCNSTVMESFPFMKCATQPTSSDASSSSSIDQFRASSSADVSLPARIMRCPPIRYPRIMRSQRPVSSKCGIESVPSASNYVENQAVSCHSLASIASAPLLNMCESSIGSPDNEQPKSSLSLYQKPSKHLPSDKVKETKLIRSSPAQEPSSSSLDLVSVDEPKTLNCRSGPSSYSLRFLKIVPLYSEHGSISGIISKSKKRAKRDTYETVMCCNNVESPKDISPINFLPDEILCKIFSYLPRLELIKTCEKVCHRWHAVARSPPLWNTLYFSGDNMCIETVAGLIRFAPPGTLKSITVKDRDDIDVILPILHQQSKRLENVSIVRCRPFVSGQKNLRAKSLYPFLRKNQLRSLNLKGTDYRSRKFYEKLKQMNSLRKLNISCSRSITPQILSEIANYPNLKVFKNKWHSDSVFYGSKSMTIQLPGKIDEWASAYSLLFQNAGQHLTTLEFYAAGISDSALSGLASCKNLKKLCVYNANCFGVESMAAVGSLTGLQELLIHNAKMTSVTVFNAFQTSNFSGLKSLHLNESISTDNDDISADTCLETIAAICPHLQHLSLTQCSGITDVGVKSLLTNCVQLLSLDLNGCPGISGQSFLLIPISTPLLKLLVIEEDSAEEKKKIAQNLTQHYGLKVQNTSTWKHRLTSFLLW